MSDWRGDEQSPKKKKPKSKGIPVIPRREGPLPPKKEAKGWSGQPITPTVKTSSDEPSWTIGDSQGAPLQTVSRRRLLLSILIPTGLIALLGFVFWIVQRQPPPIPLYVVASDPGTKFGSYAELGMLPLEDLQKISTSVSRVRREKSDFLQSDGELEWGGPSRFLTCYLQGFLVRNQDGSLGWSGPSSGSPFSGNAPIALKKVFERIASRTAKNSVSIVGLDALMPMVIHNLADLSFPADEIKKDFEALDEKLKSKLVVFLPCSQGQENWFSPRDGATIFGATFLNGCSNLFGNEGLTLEGLGNELEQRVKQWSLTNRKSAQNPVLLRSDTAWSSLKAKKFVNLLASVDERLKVPLPGGPGKDKLKARYQEIDQLWSKFDSQEQELKKHPHLRERTLLIRAALESHLLALEEIVEWNPSDEHWNHFQSQVEMLDKEWSNQTDEPYGVSRIEDQRIQVAKSFNDSDPDGLDSLLEKILKQELDPDTRDDPKKKRLADDVREKILDRWREIQRLACTPRRELSWKLETRVRELDTSLLKAVDLFVANRFEDCEMELIVSEPAIDAAMKEGERINNCFEFRDAATDFIPDALGLLMRVSRFPDAGQYELGDTGKRLATLAVELEKVEAFLRGGPSTTEADSARAKEDLQSLKSEIEKMTITKWMEGAATDPETVRNLRVAVRYRGLDSENRKSIHDKLGESLIETDRSDRTDQTDQTDQTNQTDLKGLFLAEFAARRAEDPSTPSSPFGWEQFLTQDRRWDLAERPFQPIGYSDLYREGERIRWLSGPLGMHSLSNLECILDKRKNWNAQRLQAICDEHECNYLRMQRARLLLARWGTPQRNSFQDFAERYAKRSDLIRKGLQERQIDWQVGLKNEIELKKDFEFATKSLREMRSWLSAKSSVSDSGGPIQFDWTPTKSDAAEQESLARLWGPIQPAVKLGGNTVETVALSLPENRKAEIRIPVGTGSSDAPDVIAAFRGHRVQSRVRSEQILFASSFQPTKKATLTATIQGQTRSMVIMLDCSGSMTPNSVEQSKTAIETLINIMKSRSDAKSVQIALVVFGVMQPIDKLGDFSAPKKNGLLYAHSKDDLTYTHLAHTKFYSIDSEAESVKKALGAPFVTAKSNTPLYNAISIGCDLLRGQEGEKDLVILSDGGNFTQKTIDYSDVKEKSPNYGLGKFSFKNQEGSPLELPSIKKILENESVRFFFYQVVNEEDKSRFEKYERNDDEAASNAEELGAKEAVTFLKWIQEYRKTSNNLSKKLSIITAENFPDFIEVNKKLEDDFATPMIQVDFLEKASSQIENFDKPMDLTPGTIHLSAMKKTSSGNEPLCKPLPLELFPGQHARVHFDNKQLRFESAKGLGENNKFRSELRSEKRFPYTLHWDCPPILAGEDAFRLRVNVRRPVEDPQKCLPWPRFAVGKLTRENPSENQRTLLFSDLGFQEAHYPTIQFGIKTLNDMDPKWGATDSSFKLWWSFADVEVLFGSSGAKKLVQSKSQDDFRGYQVSRNATSLLVERDIVSLDSEYADEMRWVLCPSALQTTREYRGQPEQPEQWKEILVFTLDAADATAEVPLYIVSEKDLEELAKEDVKPEGERLFQYSGIRSGSTR